MPKTPRSGRWALRIARPQHRPRLFSAGCGVRDEAPAPKCVDGSFDLYGGTSGAVSDGLLPEYPSGYPSHGHCLRFLALDHLVISM